MSAGSRWQRRRTRAMLAWTWWRAHRRWVRLRRVGAHWCTLQPVAPTVQWRAGPVIVLLVVSLVVSSLYHPSAAWALLGLTYLAVPVVNLLNRWRYQGLLQALRTRGRAWHDASLEARAHADLARLRWQAYESHLKAPPSPVQPTVRSSSPDRS